MMTSVVYQDPAEQGLLSVPFAVYDCHEVTVLLRESNSYRIESLSTKWGGSIFWEERQWPQHLEFLREYFPKRCVGFSLYCPPLLGLSGDVSVIELLRRMEMMMEMPESLLGEHRKRIHRMAKGLTVHIPPE